MPDWWSRVKDRRVPPRLLDAAGKNEEQAAEAAGASPSEVDGLPLFHRPAVTPVAGESGFRASVMALRDAEASARQAYLAAVEATRVAGEEQLAAAEAKQERCRRAWAELSKELRISEKDLLEMEAKTGDMLPKAEVRNELLRIHGAIYTGIKNLVRKVRPKLEGKLSIEQDQVWGAEVNRLFQAYQKGEFLPGFVTDDADA